MRFERNSGEDMKIEKSTVVFLATNILTGTVDHLENFPPMPKS